MAIRARPLQPKDVSKCVEIIAAHPILRHRYECILLDLEPVMVELIPLDAFGATVFEEVDNSSIRLLGAGIATFVCDDFICQLKRAPKTWATPELVTRFKQGNSPVLSRQELRDANSDNGFNLFVWHSGLSIVDVKRPEVASAMITTFFDLYRGYCIKEFCQQAETWHHFLVARAAGCYVMRPSDGRYVDHYNRTEDNFEDAPLLLGMNGDVAKRAVGSWIASALFCYEPPRIFFTRGQQRLLAVALTDATDQELAEKQGISNFAVKKLWREIYDRSSPFFPEWSSAQLGCEGPAEHRGKQKRHRLLAYLRDHPEEMRPIRRRVSREV